MNDVSGPEDLFATVRSLDDQVAVGRKAGRLSGPFSIRRPDKHGLPERFGQRDIGLKNLMKRFGTERLILKFELLQKPLKKLDAIQFMTQLLPERGDGVAEGFRKKIAE